MIYNIIVYSKYPFLPTNGGVERVSIVLGDWLVSQGHNVYYLSDEFKGKQSIFVHDKVGLDDDENFSALKKFIRCHNVNIILNQAAFMPCCKRLFELRDCVKIVSVLHHSLDGMFSHPPIPLLGWSMKTKLSQCVLFESLFRTYFYLKYHIFLQEIIKKSHHFIVLSKHYKKETEYYGCKSDNIIAIGNPLTLPICNQKSEKEDIILFVGRLSWQKNPFLLLKIWEKLSQSTKEWKLYIVGAGELKTPLEKIIKKKKIKNVFIQGSQDPIPYLKKAKILCMTSMYEGFPLVLFEAMNYYVVPIIFDTFNSSHEIISNNEDGFIIQPFNIDSYVGKVKELIDNPSLLNIFSINAHNKALANTIDILGNEWLKIFEE